MCDTSIISTHRNIMNEPLHPRLAEIYQEMADAREAPPEYDFDNGRPMKVGLKRNGLGNRVRTIDEDRKYQNRLNRKKVNRVEVKGHPCDVWHYNPNTGAISVRLMNYKWSDDDKCWVKNVDEFHNTASSELEPGVSLYPVKWCIDPNRGMYYTTYHGKRLFAHRIAWQLHHGREPHNLTFRDGNPMNLALHNLVPVAGAKPKPFQALVRDKGKVVYLGRYETKEERDEAVNTFKFKRSIGLA
jgi:heterodisulfide reductase subunit B